MRWSRTIFSAHDSHRDAVPQEGDGHEDLLFRTGLPRVLHSPWNSLFGGSGGSGRPSSHGTCSRGARGRNRLRVQAFSGLKPTLGRHSGADRIVSAADYGKRRPGRRDAFSGRPGHRVPAPVVRRVAPRSVKVLDLTKKRGEDRVAELPSSRARRAVRRTRGGPTRPAVPQRQLRGGRGCPFSHVPGCHSCCGASISPGTPGPGRE